MSIVKRTWLAIFATLLLLSILGYTLLWPALLTHLTQKEAARIAAITPQQLADTMPARLDIQRMMDNLRWLAHADRQGRAPGTAGGLAARAWLVQQYSEIGLQPAGSEGYLQPYSVPEHYQFSRLLRGINAQIPAVDDAANVLGLVPGTVAGLAPIVITAHYDHLGVHGDNIFYGADDNASGVATLLELARYIKQQPLQHPVLFIALDSEEKGLQGAMALFKHQMLKARELAFNINIDMLSRDTGQQLFAVGTYQHPWLVPLIAQVQQQSTVKLMMAHDRPWYKAGRTQNWTLSSDHGVFHQQGVPFIYFGVADHPDYHTPRDTADKVDVAFYHQVSETVLSFLQLLDSELAQR